MNTPSGMITIYGKEQLEGLAKAINCGFEMLEKGIDSGMEEKPMISVKAVTSKCYRVEISGLVETEED